MSSEHFKKIISHSKEYGFIFQSSEIYDGLSAVYDYAQNGVLLKNNLKEYWWKSMVHLHDNIVGIDSSIFSHPTTWKASGHLDAFNDPLIDNKDSKKRYRADNLIEDYITKCESKILKEQKKQEKRFGDKFNEETFIKTNPKVLKIREYISQISLRFYNALKKDDLIELKKIILDCEIVCPISGTKNWTDVKQFNLMFKTQLGATESNSTDLFLRPETAQGIFLNYLNVQKTARMKIPFGIAQIGKAFRNEIIARNFIFRTREFEQMEMQYFTKPGQDDETMKVWKEKRMNFYTGSLGISSNNLRFHEHGDNELAHYAKEAWDIEYNFPFGWSEVEGIHNRTDFDLKNHEQFSGKNLKYFDQENNERYLPYIIETSAGLNRMLLTVLSDSFWEDTENNRKVMKFDPKIAPVKAVICPLVKKDGLPEKARSIIEVLKPHFNVLYDQQGSIGKRYYRQDEAGTPFGITIDHQTMDDDTITIRYRDTQKQDRSSLENILKIIQDSLI